MRIGIDLTSLLDPPTGVANVLRNHLVGLRDRTGAEVVGFAASWRGRERLAGAVAPGTTDRLVRRPMAARPLRVLWQRGDRPRIERWTGPLDVVWGPNFVVPPAAPGVVRVVTVHDLTCVRFPELCTADVLQYPGLIRRALDAGAHVHAVSRFTAGEVVDAFGADPDRVHVVPNGVDAGAVAHGDPAAGRRLAGADRYVLAIGTIEPRKDHAGLVRAFDAVVDATGDREVRLVLAGGDGWAVEALDAALSASAAAGDGRIVRTGWIDDGDRADLLAGALVLAYPSRYEGFGLPPLEAMAAGVPVVTTDAGALPEVVGDAAEVVAAGDVDALAAALQRVLTDEGLRADLVERGRGRVEAAAWEPSRQALADLFVRLRSIRHG